MHYFHGNFQSDAIVDPFSPSVQRCPPPYLTVASKNDTPCDITFATIIIDESKSAKLLVKQCLDLLEDPSCKRLWFYMLDKYLRAHFSHYLQGVQSDLIKYYARC